MLYPLSYEGGGRHTIVAANDPGPVALQRITR